MTARNIRRWLDGQDRLDDGRAQRRRRDVPAAARGPAGRRRGRRRARPRTWSRSTAAARRPGRSCCWSATTSQLAAVGAGGALADIAERGIDLRARRGPPLHRGVGRPGVAAAARRRHHAWSTSTPSTAGSSTPAPSSRPTGRRAAPWLADTLAGRDALLVVGTNAAAARVCPTSCAPSWSASAGSPKQGVPLGMGPARSGGHRRRGRRPRPGPPQRLAPRRLGRATPRPRSTARPTASPPPTPTGGLTVARVTGRDDARRRAAGRPDPAARLLRARAGHARLRGHRARRARPHRRRRLRRRRPRHRRAPSGLRAGHPRPRHATCCSSSPAHVADTAARPARPHGAARRTAGRGARRRDPPTRGRPEPHRARPRPRPPPSRPAPPPTHVDPLLAVIADQHRRPHRSGGSTSSPPPAQLPDAPPGRARRRRGPHHAGPAAAHRRAGRPRPAPACSPTPSPPASLDGSTSVAQVLHFRIRTAHDGRLTPQVAGYADLLPRAAARADPRPGSHALAAAADARRAELGARLAEDPPQWAREALGAVPDADADPDGRADWEQRAGWAGSYRELVGTPTTRRRRSAPPRPPGSPRSTPCSTPPTPRSTCPTSAPTRRRMSEGRLRARGRRVGARTATPRPATSPTSSTPPTTPYRTRPHRRHRLGRPAPTPTTDPLAATSSRAAARQAPRDAPSSSPRRSSSCSSPTTPARRCRVDTAVTRDQRRTRPRRRRPARHRPRRPRRPGHRPGMARRPPRRPTRRRGDRREITEDDLGRRRRPRPPRSATADEARRRRRPAATFRARPAERADPAVRRRVPPPDATTAAFDRAQQVLREVAERQQAEQAAAAHAAELESEDEQLRAELARQAAHDATPTTRRRRPRRRDGRHRDARPAVAVGLVRARRSKLSVSDATVEGISPAATKGSPMVPPQPSRAGARYLDVPYSEKDEAKPVGARWDHAARRWYDPRPPTPACGAGPPDPTSRRSSRGGPQLRIRACSSTWCPRIVLVHQRPQLRHRTADWERLRRPVVRRAQGRCEACRPEARAAGQRLEVHERWSLRLRPQRAEPAPARRALPGVPLHAPTSARRRHRPRPTKRWPTCRPSPA